jgi:hypothetical protein
MKRNMVFGLEASVEAISGRLRTRPYLPVVNPLPGHEILYNFSEADITQPCSLAVKHSFKRVMSRFF